ncbi:MAG: fructose-1,6-bisphosphate aldolase, class II [Candidatus Parcubacteria bacterium]|nr:MAG: fructose-1,6-bisphosphate aldolase, class II [Candidatus Parcubacteria bacterium]
MHLKELIYSLKTGEAILHYNVATLEQIKAGILAVQETKIPLIFGVSEGERNYLSPALVKEIIDFYKKDLPIFLNADHSKSFETAKQAIDLNYDAVLFDGSELTLDENIKITKELINYRGDKNILIEGEIGKIEGKSEIQKEVEVKKENLTKVEEAIKFVEETKVDLLAVSIGNIHGITEKEPELDFERGREIAQAVKIPLVLHGASGLSLEKIKKCIEIGFKIIHLNTEFRKIWKEKLIEELGKETVTPYKILEPVVEEIKKKIVYYQVRFQDSGS